MMEEAGEGAAFASYAARRVAQASSCVTGCGWRHVGIGIGAEIAGRRLCVLVGVVMDLILESMVRLSLLCLGCLERSGEEKESGEEPLSWPQRRMYQSLYTQVDAAADPDHRF